MVVFRLWLAALICLLVLPAGVAFAAPQDMTATFRGGVERPDDRLCVGMVMLWEVNEADAETPELSNLVPPWANEIDAECQFEIMVLPGRYFLQLVVRKDASDALGPLRPGDLLFTYVSDDGKSNLLSGKSGEQIHLGTLGASTEFAGYPENVETGITGHVLDEKGEPMAGLRVLAFDNVEMISGPFAVSPVTGDDGQFRLHMAGNAEVYLQAREEIGLGLPLEGSLYGVYGGKKAMLVKVRPGKQAEMIDIIVAPRTTSETSSFSSD